MSDIVTQRNIAALGQVINLSAAATAVAAGSGDSATTTGITVDRQGFANNGGSLAGSAEMAALFAATLASGKTLSVGYAVQDSADGSNWSDYQTATYAVVATGPSGGGAVSGQLQVATNLRAARRYTRFNFAIDLNATGTDTATAQAAGFFGGFDRLAAGVN